MKLYTKAASLLLVMAVTTLDVANAQGEYSRCIAECSVAYETCCAAGFARQNFCKDLNLGRTCLTNKKHCIKACTFANDKITTEAIADVDNDNQGAGLRGHYLIKSVMEEDAVITNPSSLAVNGQNAAPCIAPCYKAWDACCGKPSSCGYKGTLFDKCNKQFHTCESENCPPTDDWYDDLDYDNVMEEDALITNPSSLTVVTNKKIHHLPTVAIASQDWAHCIDNCGTEWGICCGPYSKDDNCLRTTRAAYTLYDKCANEYNTCAGKCPPYDGVTTKVTTDFDNDNEGAGNKPIVADDFIMIQSSLVVALNEEIHHSTFVIAETRDPCFGKCSSAFMSCCGINPDCFQKAMANDRTLLNRCNAAKATCQMACPSLAEEDEATNEVTTEFDNDKDETGLLRGHLIKPVMADASGPQDYQCIENCDTGLDICCKIANTADNCILKYKQGEHTWYNNCNSAMYSCRSACPRADDKAPTVTMDIGNEGARLRDNPIKPVLDDTFIMNPSSFAVALNEETFVANAQKNKMCTVDCRTAWGTCCRYGMPSGYNCLSDNAWLSDCSTACNNCYKTCGSSGLCPTPW